MSRSFGRRLVFLATFAIAGALGALVAVVVLYGFAAYVGTLNAAESETLAQMRTWVSEHGETPDARRLALAGPFFARGIVVIALDATRRVEVREGPPAGRQAPASGVDVQVRPRNDVALETPRGKIARDTAA